MSNLVKNIIRFCLFVLAQVFILDKVPPLHQMATPYIYFLFILWLPFKIGRRMQMLVAFVLGFAVDSFNNTYGMHAASCVLIAYIRPFLINLLISQEGAESNYNEPSVQSMGFTPYLTYLTILTFIHHTCLYFLQALQTGGYVYFFLKSLISTSISLLLILLIELLFPRKQKFRTNTI
jgi:rod shape-determining protein MreD